MAGKSNQILACLRAADRAVIAFALFLFVAPCLDAQTVEPELAQAIEEIELSLAQARELESEARQRLAIRRVIRTAEELVQAHEAKDSRYLALEHLFRAQKQLIALDDDPKHRAAFMETARELAAAPDEYAAQRMQADLLVSQAELARQGAGTEERSQALKPFAERYLETSVGAEVLQIAINAAIEYGDKDLIVDLSDMIARHYASDPDLIRFQRKKLGGQVYSAPFAGSFERSDGKIASYPMDGFGHTLLLIFWSKEDGGASFAKGFVDATNEIKDSLAGRVEMISFNLDDLPDAGESIIRGMGADWLCLKLPGGREHPFYEAYAGRDPLLLRVSTTGQAAIIMEGVGRVRRHDDGSVNFSRTLGSAIGRSWTDPDYCEQLRSLSAGDHLVFDPTVAGIDPVMPPELKAADQVDVKPLTRTAESVPEDTLQAIQACFVGPSMLYQLSFSEIRANYQRAVELSRKAIQQHSRAPDLWIVRNRLITALLGLWKTEMDLNFFEEAVEAAEAALAAGYPDGCDLVALACIARSELRQPEANKAEILDQLVAHSGAEKASSSALSAAAMLALESADRSRFERYSQMLLNRHAANPMAWVFSSFLLDRHHNYWLFQVPFTAGRTYGKRERYFMSRGDPEEAPRFLQTKLRTADGGTFRIPEDLDTAYTAIYFSPPEAWDVQGDRSPSSPDRRVESFATFAANRPHQDIKVGLAILGDEPADVSLTNRSKEELPCMMLALPGGLNNPAVHRIGILDQTNCTNRVLIDREGRILAALSSLVTTRGNTMSTVVTRMDEMKVNEMLREGELEAAKSFILELCPPFDPEAVDERGRKLRKANYPLAHLRARARVYIALGQWDNALADAEEVADRILSLNSGMSMRTKELDESEALVDEIRQLKLAPIKSL